jgi:PleD family two-component response regulator
MLDTCLSVLRKGAMPAHRQWSPRAANKWASKANSAQKLRILVAEDNFVNQQLMLHVLQRNGHEVLLANDGQEVVKMFFESVDLI